MPTQKEVTITRLQEENGLLRDVVLALGGVYAAERKLQATKHPKDLEIYQDQRRHMARVFSNWLNSDYGKDRSNYSIQVDIRKGPPNGV